MRQRREGPTKRPLHAALGPGADRVLRNAGRALVVCLLTGMALAQPSIASSRAAPPPQQLLAVILSDQIVRTGPGGGQIGTLSARRPITGERTVLPVLSLRTSSRGGSWLRVRLPGRTIGASKPPSTGWISATGTQLRSTPWHIVVMLDSRLVIAYLNGRPLRAFLAIVGKPSTPTPTGQYFVEEDVRLPASDPGAPFALATSDRSNVLGEYDHGPGQIAIHGLENLGGRLGTAESHGCVRLADDSITWLAARIGPGSPVTVSRG